jgi:predicted ribosome quality control (RQC) complex YloA/Tae2 family protein
MKEFVDENKTIYWLGKNAQDNWDIISKAENEWLWFHLDKFPSGHVIICKNKDQINDEEIKYACDLCVSNSKYKSLKNLGVVYCEINNLSIGEDVGSVYFKSNKKVNTVKY